MDARDCGAVQAEAAFVRALAAAAASCNVGLLWTLCKFDARTACVRVCVDRVAPSWALGTHARNPGAFLTLCLDIDVRMGREAFVGG
jgi:D-serine deaminase-like pyridoxal phosphate-dependent protein